MADNDSTTPPGNVLNFPRLGFNLTPTTGPGPSAATPPTTPAPVPSPTPGGGGRRSPLNLLNALPDPGILQPAIPSSNLPATVPGQVPDTFRGDQTPGQAGPQLGALSMAAILAVAVAAMRGCHTVLSTWWEHRQAQYAETAELRQARAQRALQREQTAGKHEQAMQSIGDKQAQQRAKANRVPSSAEFGRQQLGGRGRGSGSGSGSGGGGSRSGSGSGSGSGSSRGPGRGRSNSGTGPSTGPTRTNNGRGPNGSGRGNTGSVNQNKKPGDGKGPDKKKPPTNGKTPTPTTGVDRARNRQERAGARQAARLERAKNRQGARLQERAKDRDAARTRKNRIKDARQDAKQDARQQRAKDKQDKKQQKAADAAKNTTLGQAVSKAARKRLKRRRKNLAPPVLTTANRPKKPKKATGPKASPKTTSAKTTKPKTTSPKAKTGKTKKAAKRNTKARTARQRQRQTRWAKARAYARRKAQAYQQKKATQGAAQGSGRNPGQAGGSGAGQQAAGAQPGAGQQAGPGTRTRRSPFQNAAAAGGSTYTVTSARVPRGQSGSQQPAAAQQGGPALPATGPAMLGAAPTVNPPRPGTTRPRSPIPMPPASRQPAVVIAQAEKGAAQTARAVVGRRMDAQHETEITLDDACDAGDELSKKAFKIHDQSERLARHAASLRDAWIVLANDCAVQHNLIGDAFTHASIRFGESMDLVRRTAEEMASASLNAAEAAETAANEINDAYRPISTATADAGLSTPSAPAHNRV